MKNIDISNLNLLLDVFSNLDEKHQCEALVAVQKVQLKQITETKVLQNPDIDSSSKHKFNEVVDKEFKAELSDTIDLMKSLRTLDKKGLAMVVAFMEHLKPGSFTETEEISVAINSKKISLEEYFNQNFPQIQLSKNY